MREWRFTNATCRAYRNYFNANITITQLYERIWHAWVKFRGGRKWINSLSSKEIIKERRDVKEGVNQFLREWML